MNLSRRLFFVAGGWLVFVLIPGILGAWLLDREMEALRLQALQDARFSLAQDSRGIIAEASPEIYSRKAFQGSAGGFSEHGVEITTTDPSTRTAIPELIELQKYLTGGPAPAGSALDKLRDRLGWETQPHTWREKPGIPLPVKWGRQSAFLMWESTQSNPAAGSASSRLSIFLPPKSAPLLEDSLRAFQARGGRGALIDLERLRWNGSTGLRSDAIKAGIRATRNRASTFRDLGDSAAWLERLPGKLALYLECRLSDSVRPGFRILLIRFHLAVFIFLSLLFPRLARKAPNWALRPKLFGIFAYLLALPLFAVILLSTTLIDDRSTLRQTELLQTARDLLMDLDAGFAKELDLTQRRYSQLLKDPDLERGDYQTFAGKARKWLDTLILDHIEVWDWSVRRRLLLTNTVEDAGFMKINELNAIRSINGALGKPAEKFFTPSMAVLLTMIENPSMGYLDFSRKPAHLHKFSFARNTFFAFWDLAAPGPASSPAMVFAVRSLQQASIRYLRGNLIGNRPLRILARDRQTELWYPRKLRLSALDSLCDGIARLGTEQLAWVQTRKGAYLALGIVGNRLSSFDLVALIPEERLLQDAGILRRLVRMGAGIAVLVGFACAFFLANTLLLPIRDISAGIRSLRAHDTDYRIPIRGNDEMARLARAFNQMFETVGEKDMARLVQESLIPRGCDAPPGYEIDLRCRMTGSIGGDYLDCFPITGNRLVFLVGDVSGHGVGSALVMAMAKAFVFLHFAEEAPPETLMERLNSTLYDLTLPNQMMCFCFGVVNTNTHDGMLFVAGNPYPLLWNAVSKTAGFLGTPRYPLGIRRHQTFTPIPFSLGAGDLLLLYTDGLVEALDLEGRPFGYPKVKSIVSQLAASGSAAVGKGVEEALTSHVSTGAMMDDLSLLTISRIR